MLKLVLPDGENYENFLATIETILQKNAKGNRLHSFDEGRILNFSFEKASTWAKAWMHLNHRLDDKFIMEPGEQTFFLKNSEGDYEIKKKPTKNGSIRSITFSADQIPKINGTQVKDANYGDIDRSGRLISSSNRSSLNALSANDRSGRLVSINDRSSCITLSAKCRSGCRLVDHSSRCSDLPFSCCS